MTFTVDYKDVELYVGSSFGFNIVYAILHSWSL